MSDQPEPEYLTLLRKLRNDARMPMTQVADRSGVSRQTVHNAFSGKTLCAPETIERIVAAMAPAGDEQATQVKRLHQQTVDARYGLTDNNWRAAGGRPPAKPVVVAAIDRLTDAVRELAEAVRHK